LVNLVLEPGGNFSVIQLIDTTPALAHPEKILTAK
jgi:hypothetical protein